MKLSQFNGRGVETTTRLRTPLPHFNRAVALRESLK